MLVPEFLEIFLAAVEAVSLGDSIEVSEVGGGGPFASAVVLGCRFSIFPEDAAVLPHRPSVPDLVGFGEVFRSLNVRLLFIGVRVEGKPVRGAGDLLALGLGSAAETSDEFLAILKVDDWGDAGERLYTVNEGDDLASGAEGVDVAHEEDFLGFESPRFFDRAEAADELVRLGGDV